MRRSTLLTAVAAGAATALLATLLPPRAWAHCEIPCGIYDDHARIDQMLEDTTTIAKAVAQINDLASRHDAESVQQLIRWTVNKDEHATSIQHIIAQYFMTQRIKPVAAGSPGWDDYAAKLALHHAVMVAAMKTKQSVDPERVDELRASIVAIEGFYPPNPGAPPAPTTRRR